MFANLTYKCRECGRRCSFPLLDELDEIQATTVVMDVLEEPICGACVMAKATFDDWEDERSPRFWFEGPGGGACACGSYSCDGGCDSYAEYRRGEKEEAYYYAHLAPNGEDFQECFDPDCKCHCGLLNGLDPENYEDMTGQYVEGYNPFSFEGFMAGETVEHILYMRDTREVVDGTFRVAAQDGDEIPF